MPAGTLLVVAAAAIAAYLPALANGFVWDDPLILDHQLPRFRTLRDVFFPPRDLAHAGWWYYRPLVFLSYLLDQRIGGGGPLAFHVTPIALHALASSLLCLLLWRLLEGRGGPAAALAALAFAVHPVHAEAVAWMAGRADELALAGVLAALLAWGRWLTSGRPLWLVAGGSALFLGLLGKETAIAGGLLAAALPWVWPDRVSRDRRRIAALWGSIGAATFAYLLLRSLSPGLAPGAMRATATLELARELCGALGFYAQALLWPTRPGVVLTAVPTGGRAVVAGLIAALLFGLGLGWTLRNGAALAAWSLAWIALTLSPSLLLVLRFISETPVAERYLYLPSAGAALLAGWGLARLPQHWKRPAAAAVAVVLVAAGAVTARRATLWRDELRFWHNAVALAPEEGPAHLKLAAAFLLRQDLAAAEATYRAALGARLTAAQRAHAQTNLAQLLLMRGEADEAEPLARAALTAAAPETAAYAAFLLGHANLARQDRPQAARWFQHAIEVAPGSARAAQADAALSTFGLR